MMVLLLADLGWGGFTAGATRWYFADRDGSSFYAQETVLTVGPWDGTGSRCSFSTSVDRADFYIYSFSYDPYTDTGYAYYDGTYLVDFVNAYRSFYFSESGMRVLKFPLIVGDTWQTVDTCKYALGVKRSIGYDENWDGLEDSLYYDTSYAVLVHYSGDTAEVHIYPFKVIFYYTGMWPDTGGYMGCCEEHIAHHYIRLRYVNGTGMVLFSTDSLVGYLVYSLVDTTTTPWDTIPLPPLRYWFFTNFNVWTYTTTSVSEIRPRITFTPYRLNGRRLTALEDLTLYSYDGRLVGEVRKGSTVSLKPGLYFVRSRGRTGKVVVR